MSCDNQILTQDLINAKEDAITLGEVATSRKDAESGGNPITESTNRFGQATDTIQGRLNKLGVIVDDPIRDWSSSLLVSDLRAHRYPATTGDIYIPAKPLPFTTGLSFNADDWILFQSVFDKDRVVPFDTITQASIETDTTKIFNGATLNISGRTSKNDGGGATWDVIAQGTTPNIDLPNTYNVIDLVGVAGLVAVLRVKETVVDTVFGVTGSSSASDTAAFMFAMEYASDNGYKFISNTDFTASENLEIKDDIDLELNSTITLGSGVTNGITTEQVQRGSSSLLTANAASGDRTLTVNTSVFSGLAVGDFLKVSSSEVFDPRTNSLTSEGALVLSFGATSVELDRPIVFGYTTSNNAKVEVFKSYKVNIHGKGKIIGDGTSSQFAINPFYCSRESSINGISALSCFLGSFRFSHSVDSKILNVEGEDSQALTLGYTTSVFGACKNITIDHFISSNARHAFTTSTPSAPNSGVPIDIFAVHGLSKYTVNNGDAFDTHAATWNVNILKCISYNSSSSGYNFESSSGSIKDCQEYNSAKEGYRVRNETFKAGVFRFTGNDGDGCTENGMQLGSSNEPTAIPFSKAIIDLNTYDSAGQNGVWLQTGLADEVLVGAISASNSSSTDVIYDTENIGFTSGYDNTLSDVTMASGAITFMSPIMNVTPQSGVGGTESLTTINGGRTGQKLTLKSSSNSNTITIDDIADNINCAGDFVMNSSSDRIFLEKCDDGRWYEISRSDNS